MHTQSGRSHDEIGAHVSSAGGVRNGPDRAAALDSVVLQLFTKQASRWAEPVPSDDDVAAYRDAAARNGIVAASAHDSYLINLASPDPVLRARSIDSFRREIARCTRFGIQFIVTHPGNATDDDFDGGIARNAEAVQQALEEEPGEVMVLFETTAGTGRALGATFEQLHALITRIPDRLQRRIGVCLDTCHVWAAGYDLRSAYDDVMQRFDGILGLDRIRMFHLNDSVGALGCRRDRHAHIGTGALGEDAFRSLMRDPRFLTVPKVIETPKDAETADRRNIALLRGMRNGLT